MNTRGLQSSSLQCVLTQGANRRRARGGSFFRKSRRDCSRNLSLLASVLVLGRGTYFIAISLSHSSMFLGGSVFKSEDLKARGIFKIELVGAHFQFHLRELNGNVRHCCSHGAYQVHHVPRPWPSCREKNNGEVVAEEEQCSVEVFGLKCALCITAREL